MSGRRPTSTFTKPSTSECLLAPSRQEFQFVSREGPEDDAEGAHENSDDDPVYDTNSEFSAASEHHATGQILQPVRAAGGPVPVLPTKHHGLRHLRYVNSADLGQHVAQNPDNEPHLLQHVWASITHRGMPQPRL